MFWVGFVSGTKKMLIRKVVKKCDDLGVKGPFKQ